VVKRMTAPGVGEERVRESEPVKVPAGWENATGSGGAGVQLTEARRPMLRTGRAGSLELRRS
jgi:hypothetical protein